MIDYNFGRIMKDEVITEQTYRTSQGHMSSNRIIYRCEKERNGYIRREVGDLIKKQLKIFFATEKLEKEIEDKNKDMIFTTPQSPIEKVSHFRQVQREKQCQKLRAFKIKNADRMKKLAAKLKEKSISHLSKTAQNFHRMSRVQKRFEGNLARENERIEELKKNLMIDSPRPTHKAYLLSVPQSQKIHLGINQARLRAQEKEQIQINTYLTKMKTLEERKIENQIKLQQHKSQSLKKVPKYSLAMRLKEEEQLVKKWTNQYEKKIQAFDNSFRSMTIDKNKAIYERSLERLQAKNQVIERKIEQENQMGQKRVQMMQSKIMKISKIPGRNYHHIIESKSKASFNHNIKKFHEDDQKEKHHIIMRQIYNIVEKLKTLGDGEKLKKSQIDFLLQNLDPNENTQDYKELYGYLNSTKQKFFEQKRKEEEERMKKNKKNNAKML